MDFRSGFRPGSPETANDSDNNTGPKILRPIPRRPFNLNNLLGPTPPPDEDLTPSPALPTTPRITAADLRFLDPRYQQQQQQKVKENGNNYFGGSSDSRPMSRVASYMNLTASTLFGIYSPSTPGPEGNSTPSGGVNGRAERNEAAAEAILEESEPTTGDTPWGTGAETPAQRPGGLDDQTYALMRDRRSRPSFSYQAVPGEKSVRPSLVANDDDATIGRGSASGIVAVVASSLVFRAVLLFAMGMGYGVLVTRLPNSSRRGHLTSSSAGTSTGGSNASSYDWRYLTFWGGAGVALGTLLPWFDQVWEETFGRRQRLRRKQQLTATKPTSTRKGRKTAKGSTGKEETADNSSSPATREAQDWALVIRGVGAFVGIVFAIRRLPWTSTMQVSLTLALANPFLWYLIDRSKPGFLFSTVVGLAGSAILTGLGTTDLMPAPISSSMGSLSESTRGAGPSNASFSSTPPSSSYSLKTNAGGFYGGEDAIEAGIWMVSVLFCSCVCFGNIGRRLALNRSSALRGRWGGVR